MLVGVALINPVPRSNQPPYPPFSSNPSVHSRHHHAGRVLLQPPSTGHAGASGNSYLSVRNLLSLTKMCITPSKNEVQDLTESAGERHVITPPRRSVSLSLMASRWCGVPISYHNFITLRMCTDPWLL